MGEAEQVGIEVGARFITLNTMDWEALLFYEKLGYAIEFIRAGYDKDSKMFMLRKNLLESEFLQFESDGPFCPRTRENLN